MTSTTKRGNYYKKKTKDWFEEQGYTVELTEFVCGTQIPNGRLFYRKIDILASDGIAYNDKEFILWNSKHCTTTKETYDRIKNYGKADYKKIVVPPFIKKQLIIWEPRKKPVIVEL